jgi:hypothetical protein
MKARFADEHIISIIKEQEAGEKTADVCRRHALPGRQSIQGVDTFADKIVGSRVSRSPKTDFMLNDFEHARHDRRPVHKGGLSHHSDRGGNICPLAKPSGWPPRGSCPRLAASVTLAITPLSALNLLRLKSKGSVFWSTCGAR